MIITTDPQCTDLPPAYASDYERLWSKRRKEKVRSTFDKLDEPSLIHAADNTFESWEYIDFWFPDEIHNIREEIEAKQGRLKYLQNKVALSTIDIEFYKLTSEAPVAKSYGTKMWNAIKGGFNGISLFFLGLLYIWPLIVIAVIGIFLLRRWMRKSKK